MKVFGSPAVGTTLKLQFMWSLVLSRLLFNVHTTVPTPKYIKQLNNVYMHVLRRIADKCRFERTVRDIEVRQILCMPSIDCIIMISRLRYLSRLVQSRPPALLALLSSRPRSTSLAWVQLAVRDMQTLRARVSLCSSLPDPADGPQQWTSFILEDPVRCSLAVNTLHFEESSCDPLPAPKQQDNEAVTQHICSDCSACFATSKALKAHQRTKHGLRAPQRYFANEDGICQVCGTCYNARLRLLAHLCDSRRTQCWTRICTDPRSYSKIQQAQVDILDTNFFFPRALRLHIILS